jgi:hypothetical protein
MSRSFVPVFLLAAVCGFARLAHADTCPLLPGPQDCAVTGSIANGEGQFSIPQFDPALGHATGFNLLINATLSGTNTISVTCGERPPFACNYGYSMEPVLSVSESSISFTATGTEVGAVPLICLSGETCTDTLGWNTYVNGGTDSPALTSALTGTGEVTFGISESVTNYLGTPGSISFDPAPFDALLVYNVTPATVPEPSLAWGTAAIFGLILWRRLRRPALRRSSTTAPVRAGSPVRLRSAITGYAASGLESVSTVG